MADSIILNKAGSIERCLERILEDYVGKEKEFREDHMRQDAVILNLQRACKQAIDLANHLVKLKKAGTPQSSKSAFELLAAAGILDKNLAANLAKMVIFRNIAIHQYQKIDLQIVEAIIQKHLTDFRTFVRTALKFA